MDNAMEAGAQRVRDHLQRPIPGVDPAVVSTSPMPGAYVLSFDDA